MKRRYPTRSRSGRRQAVSARTRGCRTAAPKSALRAARFAPELAPITRVVEARRPRHLPPARRPADLCARSAPSLASDPSGCWPTRWMGMAATSGVNTRRGFRVHRGCRRWRARARSSSSAEVGGWNPPVLNAASRTTWSKSWLQAQVSTSAASPSGFAGTSSTGSAHRPPSRGNVGSPYTRQRNAGSARPTSQPSPRTRFSPYDNL